MMIRVSLLCLAIFAGAVYCQTLGQLFTEYGCKNLRNNDCNTHKVDETCGSDGVTYKNPCWLGKSYCANDTHQAHKGPCTNDPHATRGPDEVKHGSEVVFDIECAYLSLRACYPSTNEKICGTDGYTYPNFCEYQKARCTHRHLHYVNLGECKP